MIHPNVTKAIEDFRSAYLQLPWYKKLFIPNSLKKKLLKEQYVATDVEAICYAFERSWFARLWFTCLKKFGETSIAKTYRLMVKKEQPILYWFGLWKPLKAASQEQFLAAVQHPQGHTPTQEAITLLPPPQQTTNLEPAKPKPIHWKIRAFEEKKTKFLEKIDLLRKFLESELARLETACVPHEALKKKCLQLENDIRAEEYTMYHKEKWSHNDCKWETKEVFIPCACGACLRGICSLCRTTCGYTTEQKWVTKSVYVPDQEGREAARLRYVSLQAELQQVISDYDQNPESSQQKLDYSNRQKLFFKSFSLNEPFKITDEQTFATELSRYKNILAEVTLLVPPSFNKSDYLPISQYTEYRLAAEMVQRGPFKQRIPSVIQKHIAQFLVGKEFPKEDSEEIFTQNTPN